MRVLNETVLLDDVLVAWGLHEGRGRWRAEVEGAAPGVLSGTDHDPRVRSVGRSVAEQMRSPLLDAVSRAHVHRVVRVVIEPTERDQVHVLTSPTTLAPTLPEQAAQLRDDPYVNGLRQQPAPIRSQLIGIARGPALPFLLFDGVHRGSAWWWRCEDGKQEPLEVAVVLTAERCWFEGTER